MGKIATTAALERALAQRARHGTPGSATGRTLAAGDGWTVLDVICTSGPEDRPFEEMHSNVSLAIVAAGTFQYRSSRGRAMLTPGSVLLGSAGTCFECGHEHARGDRCIAFNYRPEFFEQVARDAGATSPSPVFNGPRLPPLRELSGIVAQACAALVDGNNVSWEEVAVRFAGRVAQLAGGDLVPPASLPADNVARVTRAVRHIAASPSASHTLATLARVAELSPYHFLRTFERVTGVTPHQFVRRWRLRDAAMRLFTDQSPVIDVAFGSGFNDLSNFNKAFRAEFDLTPSRFRRVGETSGQRP